MLGIPTDVVDATEHLLQLADDLEPRRIDLGRVNGRYFVFSSGVGIDAEATALGRRPPAAEGAQRRPATFTLRGAAQLPPQLPRPPAAARGRRSATQRVGGRQRDRPELRPVHLLPLDARCASARTSPSTTARSRSTMMRRASLMLDAPGDPVPALLAQGPPRRSTARPSSFPRIAARHRALARRPPAAARGRRRLHRRQLARRSTRPRPASLLILA